jgi:rhamnosyltransferase
VIIPTFNGETYLAEALDAVRGQRFDGAVEVFVIDSGSTDATLDILGARPWVRVHSIPNEEFGHGRTRNLAARMAGGRIVVFLTQDAIPSHDRWLAELVAPLAGGAVASTGLQIPRASCFPMLKYEINGVFRKQGPADRVSFVRKGDHEPDGRELDEMTFYSDVNAATTREFLVEVIPYRDLPYSEDFAFAKDLILAGYTKAYTPMGSVIHSNDLTLREYGKRFYEEVVARRRVGHVLPPLTRGRQIVRFGYGVLGDSGRIIRDRDYGPIATIGWLVRNPAYQLAKWRSMYRATHVDLDDHATIDSESLEAERKSRA